MKEEDIICPYCQHKHDQEIKWRHVTYWGDNDPTECSCENCNKKFMVDEQVERQFICTKMENKK